MGRKQKYITEEEKLTAKRERQMRYYWKNAKKMRKEALERYYERKQKNI
jgi:hypothetical protein